jgi:uncharacterized protein (TIGR03437 family)
MLRLLCGLSMLAGLATAQQPTVFTGGVINNASFAKGQPVAPGSEVAIFGTGLAQSLASFDTVPLSTSLAGTSVSFNGIQAPVYSVVNDLPHGDGGTYGQVNAQVPWNVAPGSVNVVVTTSKGSSAPLAVQIAAQAPGVFSFPNSPYAIAINADGSLAAPAGVVPGVATHPAKVGDVLVVYATGLGAVSPAVANGAASLDQLRNTVAMPVVMIGGKQAVVSFSGLTPQFPGINQLNVAVPQGTASGSSVPLQIVLGGITTSATVVIAVQ